MDAGWLPGAAAGAPVVRPVGARAGEPGRLGCAILGAVVGHPDAIVDGVEEALTDIDPFPEEDLVPSPGGWVPPVGCRPGWNWVPRGGTIAAPDRMARWIQLLYRMPFVDRYAHEVMWNRGGFLVLPPGHRWFDR